MEIAIGVLDGVELCGDGTKIRHLVGISNCVADYRVSGALGDRFDFGYEIGDCAVVGMQKEEPVRRFTTGMTFGRFLPAEGAASMCGVAVEIDPATGLATCIAPVRLGGPIEQRTPGFWE